jgi:cell division transport system permease protein
MRSIPFLLREALINLRRHGLMTVAAVTTIGVALTLVGAFVLTFQQITAMSKRTVDAFEMRVFCRREIEKDRVKTLEKRLGKLPEVASVEYRASKDAFADATKHLPIDTEGIPNLMPDTFVVKLTDASAGPKVAEIVRGWKPEIENVDLPEEEMKVVVKLVAFLRTLGGIGGILLLFGALVVVMNTIRLSVFSRRREIKIMQIVGAKPWFIRLPMLIEGLIHGLLGGLIATLALFVLRHYTDQLALQIPLIASYTVAFDLASFGGGLLGTGALLGVIGSFLSVHRYLRD